MKILLDDMILTKSHPTTAGSRMLDGYMSLFDATVAEKLSAAGHELAGKSPVGELAIDLAGETNYRGEGALVGAVQSGEADAIVCFDVNGAPRRLAAQSGLCFAKPTYGIVSRYGTVSAACSGECVGVMAANAAGCRALLADMVGKDDRDATMHTDEVCKAAVAAAAAPRKVGVLTAFFEGVDADVSAKLEAAKAKLAADGVELVMLDGKELLAAKTAWNMLMCAELCNNVSRYDGIKYGYRTKNYKNLDELYTNSRTEAFGLMLKTAILYGSDVLSTKNYMGKYDKALRVRRVMVEAFASLFAECDAVLMPAISKMAYTAADSAFEENVYTAPASITGLPCVVSAGVQLVGPAFSDGALLALAEILEKEGR